MIREPTGNEVAVTEAVRRHTVRAALSAKVLATDEVSVVAIEKWQKGERQPTAAKLRAILPGAIRADPVAALDFLSDVLGLGDAGVVVALAPDSNEVEAVAKEVDDALLATADTKRWQLDAAPGGYSEDERAEGRTKIRHAQRHLVEAAAALDAVPSPQLDLAGAIP